MKLKVQIDASPIREATEAFEELTAAAIKADAAIRKIGGSVHVSVETELAQDCEHERLMGEVAKGIDRGARMSDHRFKL